MTALARGFVAVVPSPAALDALEQVLAPLRGAAPPRLAWSRRAQWHVTVQFLGRVDDADALARALAARLAHEPSVALGLGGAGAFPSAPRASVLWVGVDQGAPELGALARAVEAVTGAFGHERDGRRYTPHVTVARARRPVAVGPLLAAIGDGPVGPVWEAHDVLLMESDTRPTGAVHREVARFGLGVLL